MNRQNNLKIILTTVIVLVISAMAVFTVVNWNEIVKKFQGAAAKAEGIEKHERNTVPPTNDNSILQKNNAKDEWKENSIQKDDSKLTQNSTIESKELKLPKLEETKKNDFNSKETNQRELDEPPTLKLENSHSPDSLEDNEEYPMGNDKNIDSKKTISEKTPNKLKNEKNDSTKKSPTKSISKTIKEKKTNKNNSKLEKRVRFLEKQLGVKPYSSKRKPSLHKRVYRLEKIIAKKRKKK